MEEGYLARAARRKVMAMAMGERVARSCISGGAGGLEEVVVVVVVVVVACIGEREAKVGIIGEAADRNGGARRIEIYG